MSPNDLYQFQTAMHIIRGLQGAGLGGVIWNKLYFVLNRRWPTIDHKAFNALTYFWHLQRHSSVHGSSSLLHLQDTHPRADLQAHLIKSLQASAEIGCVIHTGCHFPSSSFHPKSSGEGISGWASKPFCQIPAWNATRLTCWRSAFFKRKINRIMEMRSGKHSFNLIIEFIIYTIVMFTVKSISATVICIKKRIERYTQMLFSPVLEE